jgi:integrase/recombinase XerD
LKQYISGAKPKDYLFNGREKGDPLGHGAVQQTIRLAMQKSGIKEETTVHTLRHNFATGRRFGHLLEQGAVRACQNRNHHDIPACGQGEQSKRS